MKPVLGVLLLSLVLCGISPAQSKKAPDFALKTADGKNIQLSKLEGKVVLVNFWATWCGPCRSEIPGFLDVYEKYKSRGLEIVGVALDETGWDVVTPFVERLKITYPVVIGTGKVVKAYGGFEYIPASFLVDKKGNIIDEHIGYLPKEDLEKKLKKIL